MNLKSIVITAFVLLFLAGCDDRKNVPAFANPDAPEYRALKFFDALYNEKNLGKVQKYTTPKLSRIIRSYGTTRGYARYVLNLQVDPGVELNIDRSLNQVSMNKGDSTYVNILFTGNHNDEPVRDVRKVVFTKVNGEWLINDIEDDPYMKSGI